MPSISIRKRFTTSKSARKENLQNVEVDPDASRTIRQLPPGSVDAVLMLKTYSTRLRSLSICCETCVRRCVLAQGSASSIATETEKITGSAATLAIREAKEAGYRLAINTIS